MPRYFLNFYLFVYLWLHWVYIAVHGPFSLHVESSCTRGQTCVLCSGRQIPTTGPPGKSPDVSFIKYSGVFRDSFLGMRLMCKSVDFDESR